MDSEDEKLTHRQGATMHAAVYKTTQCKGTSSYCEFATHSFGNVLAEDLFFDRQRRATRRFPAELQRAARRKILYLHDAAVLDDLRVPPGNRLEALKGRLKGLHSIRVNDRWRVVFRWEHGSAFDVAVVDYH